jgi:hypothetical protein
VTGSGSLEVGDGQITFEGNYGLGVFSTALFPQGSLAQRVNVRLQNIDVQSLPVANSVPNLQAVLAGRIQLSGGQIVGRILSPELQVEDKLLAAWRCVARSGAVVSLRRLTRHTPKV